MIQTTFPKEITRQIAGFCKVVSKKSKPIFLDLQTEFWCQIGECYSNVQRKVQESGGRVQYGWIVWEWPNVLLDAESHAVWQSPSREFVDITPKVDGESRVLFLPDDRNVYSGFRIDNKRHPLIDDQLLRDFIFASKVRTQLLNEASKPYENSMSFSNTKFDDLNTVQQAISFTLTAIQFGKNQNNVCSCDSGNPYINCCSQNIEEVLRGIQNRILS